MGLNRYKELGLLAVYLENERQQAECLESLGGVGETPAASVEGFAAKVLVLCEYCNDQGGWIEILARSAKADAERLWQFPITRFEAEDSVLVLKREWDIRRERLESEPDESDAVRDPLFDRMNEMEYAIHGTPATTVAGVAVKLWLWTRTISPMNAGVDWWKAPLSEMTEPRQGWLEFVPVASALQDLERMSREDVTLAALLPHCRHGVPDYLSRGGRGGPDAASREQ